MKRLPALAVLAASLSVPAAPTPNPRLAALADNTWMVLDSVAPRLLAASNYFAYSGGAYDRTHHQFLVFGGGHFDGYKNDVLAFDISANTWKSMYPSDSLSDYTCGNLDTLRPGMLVESGLPASRHTYDQIDFIEHLGRMVMWSNALHASLWNCFSNMSPYTVSPRDTWLYDYASNTWEYRNAAHAPQPLNHGCGAYDPAGRRLYALSENSETWSYDDSADMWMKLSPQGTVPSGYSRVMIADRTRRNLWVWPDVYDIRANRWSRMGGGPSVNEGAYDEVNDVLVYSRGGRVLVYDIAAGAWDSTLSPAGPAPVYTPSSSDPYGRFFYDPVDNVHLLIRNVNYSPRTWAYRYKRAQASVERKTVAPGFNLSARAKIRIFDIRGKKRAEFEGSAASARLEGRGLPSGLYILKATVMSREYSRKILVQK